MSEETYRRAGENALVTKDRKPTMLTVFEDSNAAITVNAPIAEADWCGKKLVIRCASVRDYQAAKDLCEGNEPAVAAPRGDVKRLIKVARLAFGGDECPFTEEQMLDFPRPFTVLMGEAVQVFFWEGPLVDLSQGTEEKTKEAPTTEA